MTASNSLLHRRIKYKLVRGLLDLIILVALRDNEMSGYEMIGFVYNTFNVLLSPGTVYPLLQSLQEMELIEVAHEHRKRTFRLSEKGHELIDSISMEYLNIQTKVLALWGQPPLTLSDIQQESRQQI